jgi:hypothetical protein
MSVGVFTQYQTAEPWARAMPVHRADKAPPKSDVHVFGVPVVVVFDDGRMLLHLLNASGAESI